jgi:hypothetical protein
MLIISGIWFHMKESRLIPSKLIIWLNRQYQQPLNHWGDFRGWHAIIENLSKAMVWLLPHSFKWSYKATEAFNKLEEEETQPPVLRLPNFSIPVVIEYDASSTSLGAVFRQEGQPIALFSQTLKGRTLLLSTYEKELLSLVTVVQRWRPDLLGQSFKVRRDH